MKKNIEDLFSEFRDKECRMCGTQRCDGSPEWRSGCTLWQKFRKKAELEWPGDEEVMRVFKKLETYGIIRDDLCFDPQHFIETTLKEHWNDDNEND